MPDPLLAVARGCSSCLLAADLPSSRYLCRHPDAPRRQVPIFASAESTRQSWCPLVGRDVVVRMVGVVP